MSVLFALSVAAGLVSAGGMASGIWGAAEIGKEQKQIPEIRETVKQDYQNGNINTEQYTVKIEELAKQDAELSAGKVLCITFSVVSAIGAGVFTWSAVDEAKYL